MMYGQNDPDTAYPVLGFEGELRGLGRSGTKADPKRTGVQKRLREARCFLPGHSVSVRFRNSEGPHFEPLSPEAAQRLGLELEKSPAKG